MNRLKKIIASIAAIATLCVPIIASAQVVLFPGRGGTGTSTVPTYGKVLVGQSNGTYGPQATSTLGLTSPWTSLVNNIYYALGNVGIGTTTPYAALSVVGEVVSSFFTSTSTTATNSFSGNLTVGSAASPSLSVTPGGTARVGIATTSPWRTLSVNGSSDLGTNALAGYFTATTSIASFFPYASTTAISATTLCLTGDTCRMTWPTVGSSASTTLLSDNNTFSGLNMFTGATTTFKNAVNIGTTGTFTDGSKLLVSGTVTASSTATMPPVVRGLVLYVNPQSGFVYRNGSNGVIKTWNDISGNKNNLTISDAQSDVNLSPRSIPYTATNLDQALNSAVGYNETLSNSFRQRLNIPSSLSLSSQSMSVFVVAEPAYNAYDMAVYSASSSYSYAYPAILANLSYNNGVDGGKVALQNGTTSTTFEAVDSQSTAGTQLYGFTSGSSYTTVYHNNKAFPVTQLTATTTNGGYIGTNNGAQQAFSGQVREVLIYNRELSNPEVNAIQEWLNQKYNMFNKQSTRVLLVGDSITAGYGSDFGNNNYPNMVAGNKNLEVLNFGVSGISASSYDSVFTRVTSKAVTGKQNVAVLLIGTNDIAGGSGAAATIASIRSLGTKLRTAGIKSAVMTIIPRGTLTPAQEADRISVNQSLRSDGNAYFDYLSDLASDPIFASTTGSVAWSNKRYYSSADDTHLASGGNEVLQKYASIAIDRLTNPSTAGNFGIGTTTPYATLSVHLNASSTNTTAFAIGSSTLLTNTTLYSINNVGSTTASNGFNITAGCFSINGTCVTSGGASLSGGTAGMLSAWTSSSALTATGTPTAASYVATSSVASIFPYATSTALSVTGKTYFGALNGTTVDTNGYVTINAPQSTTAGTPLEINSYSNSATVYPWRVYANNRSQNLSASWQRMTPSTDFEIASDYAAASLWLLNDRSDTGSVCIAQAGGALLQGCNARLGTYGYNGVSGAGTVTITTGSSTITGSGTAFNTAVASGYTITISTVVYPIKSVESATSLTIYGKTASTNSGLSYTYAKPTFRATDYGLSKIFDITSNGSNIITDSVYPKYILNGPGTWYMGVQSTNNGGLEFVNDTLHTTPFLINGLATSSSLVIGSNSNVGVGTSTPVSLLTVGKDTTGLATSTVFIDSAAAKGSCLVMKDVDGVGYTYITANNGALTASTVNCQ